MPNRLNPKIAVYGAGAMGTVLGALLTKTGADVTLITRNQSHVDGLNKNGAKILCKAVGSEMTIPVYAITPSEITEEYDLIFLMTKQRENEKTANFLLDYLKEDGVLCTTQNGLPEQLLSEIIGEEKMLHVQITAKKAEDIVREAQLLKERIGGNFYVKIPISEEGLKATMMLRKLDIKVTMTAIFTSAQALLAAKAGASFVAPYVNRLDNIIGDGVDVVAQIVELFQTHGLDTQVLAASFKTAEQVHKCALCGCHSVTVTHDVLRNLTTHPMTDAAVAGFEKDWQRVYGNATLETL